MNSETKQKILQLKKDKNAVILAHYYVSDEVQELADFVGDSFYLAKIAKQSTAEILVFCGVSFMGESAKILNPDKKVLMPDATADCPMAHMASLRAIAEMRRSYEDLAVVCYINSTAELKCHSDVCVTSSNAVRIVRSLPNRNIFFIPDKNLGSFVAKQVPEKNILLNPGCCPIHAGISPQEIAAEKQAHPSAKVLAHPECEEEILALSDCIGSTAELIDYVHGSTDTEFIIATENGIAYRLKQENPNKRFYFPKTVPCCHDMKQITPEKILQVLTTEENAVTIDKEVASKAILPLERMLQLAK